MAQSHSCTALLRRFRGLVRRQPVLACALFVSGAVFAPDLTQDAVANGDTRTLTLYHAHTKETTTATYRVNGQYDSAALQKLNWATRDWRRDEPTRMDPRLFDVVWEASRGAGSRGPITIMSAYRSPETNSMLRRRSRGVAKHSQHMLGKAMDIHLGDVSMARVREVGMRMQRGGVGYYPRANSPFVHLDVGSVRSWPRMSYDQLARLFPDGKTVHLPSNGQPLPGYHAALAEIERNGGRAFGSQYVTTGQTKSLFALLFGSREDDDEGEGEVVVANSYGGNVAADSSPAASPPSQSAAAPVRTAMRNLPRGQTEMRPASPAAVPAAPRPAAAPIAVAAVDAPLPPRRPAELIAAAIAEEKAAEEKKTEEARTRLADVPLPPVRPAELTLAAATRGGRVQTAAIDTSRLDPIAAKIASLPPLKPALPDVITQGTPRSVEGSAAGLGLLAYAPTPPARPEAGGTSVRAASSSAAPIRQSARTALRGSEKARDFLVAARIDRSNFRALTSGEPAERLDVQANLLGSNVTPLRKAARNDIVALALRDTAEVVSRFGSAPAGDLTPGKFSGGAAARPISDIESFGQLPRR